jgi:SAM-dependent methyltransferase
MGAKNTRRHPVGKRFRVFPVDYQKSDGIHIPKDLGERIEYSDGDATEEYILQVVKNAADRSLFSPEIVRSARDQASSYHLTPRRANLLRPFSEMLRSRVLELNAGCGTVTRFLGEVGGEVVAVERSQRRTLIARERTKDLDNVDVVLDSIENIFSCELFDVIVAIGALEHSPTYPQGASEPEQTFLEQLNQLLKPDGVLILSVKNKLGLNYLAGARESDFGAPLIEKSDKYPIELVRSFGHVELRALLNKVNLKEQRWYIPCPDYQLPTTILSPKIMSRNDQLAATLLAQSVALDTQRPSDPSFSLEQIWSFVEKNELIEHLANSFLVVAGRSAAALTKIDRDSSVAWHYSIDRHPAFVKQAQFVQRKNGIFVRRSHLQAEPAPAFPLECIIESERYVDGTNWWCALLSILNKPNWSVRLIADWARVWIDALLKECKLDTFSGETFRTYVGGRYFDAAPFNMICAADGACRFIDQEWRLRPDIEFGYLVYRGLRDSLGRVTSSATPEKNTTVNINLLISAVLAELGVMLTSIELDRFSLLEQQVQSWAQGLTAESVSDDWIANMRNRALNQRAPRDRAALIQERALAVAEGEKKVAKIAEQLIAAGDLSEQLERQRDELAAALEEEKAVKARASEQAALLQREAEIMRAVAGEREAAIAKLTTELDAARSLAQQRVVERDQCAAALETEKATVAAATAQAVSLQQQAETLRAVVAERENAVARLKIELDLAQTASNDRKSEIDKLTAAVKLGQAIIRDRERDMEHLSSDIDATRLYLRDSQAEVQRLAGELDGARTEIERANAESHRIAERLQEGHDALSLSATELPAVRNEIGILEAALEELRQKADRKVGRMHESSSAFQSASTQAQAEATTLAETREKEALETALTAYMRASREEAAAQAVRIRDLAADLEDMSVEKDHLADELAKLAAEIRRVEESAADRAAALDALRTAALAERENRAQAQIRSLRDQLIDAESALAKGKRERKEAYWAGPFSESRRAARALKKSGLVDAEWYLREYPDVAKSGRAPAEHYVAEGYARGYLPNPFFDTRWYLERYEDVRRSGMNPLLHYVQYGAREGRDPGPNFQTQYYLESNPDVRENGNNPLAHYLRHGRHEGRLPAPRA